jgi:small neutral amino acid transporter SnatA (MarC family)
MNDDTKQIRLLSWTPMLLGALLVALAGVHRVQFHLYGGERYAQSPLGSIELLLAVVILLVVCGWAVWLLSLAVRKRWRDVGIAAINIACGLLLLVLAVEIDTLTLIPT